MIYLDELAGRIKQAVAQTGSAPVASQDLFRMYALLALAKGTHVSDSDVHDAWVAWMLARDDHHEALVPFGALSKEEQAKDRPFTEAIIAVATDLAAEGHTFEAQAQ